MFALVALLGVAVGEGAGDAPIGMNEPNSFSLLVLVESLAVTVGEGAGDATVSMYVGMYVGMYKSSDEGANGAVTVGRGEVGTTEEVGALAVSSIVSLAVHGSAVLQSSVSHAMNPEFAYIAAVISKSSRGVLVCTDSCVPFVLCAAVQGESKGSELAQSRQNDMQLYS